MNENLVMECEKFYDSEWGDKPIRVHSSCVVESCVNMIKDTDLDPEIFIIAGWIHDLGRKIDVKNHHHISIEFLNKFLQQNPAYIPKKDLIEDCIINHRREGKPKTVYGMIFQAADKVALHHKRWKDSQFSFS